MTSNIPHGGVLGPPPPPGFAGSGDSGNDVLTVGAADVISDPPRPELGTEIVSPDSNPTSDVVELLPTHALKKPQQ